jgi:hypothetical protein
MKPSTILVLLLVFTWVMFVLIFKAFGHDPSSEEVSQSIFSSSNYSDSGGGYNSNSIWGGGVFQNSDAWRESSNGSWESSSLYNSNPWGQQPSNAWSNGGLSFGLRSY